jgi:hypothetical protein
MAYKAANFGDPSLGVLMMMDGRNLRALGLPQCWRFRVVHRAPIFLSTGDMVESPGTERARFLLLFRSVDNNHKREVSQTSAKSKYDYSLLSVGRTVLSSIDIRRLCRRLHPPLISSVGRPPSDATVARSPHHRRRHHRADASHNSHNYRSYQDRPLTAVATRK